MVLRLPSGWRGLAIRRWWCWYRPGAFPPTGGGSPAVLPAGSFRRASCRGMRWPRWFRDGVTAPGPRLRMAAWLAGLVVGLGAEWLARSSQSLPEAGADLAVGWALIACGLLGWSRRPQSRIGLLLALTGFTWFLGTLAGSRIGGVAALGAALLFVHRGPLCHAIIGYPRGQAPGRLSLVVVAAAYVYSAA